jgi:beta-1,4-mannosyltransferase
MKVLESVGPPGATTKYVDQVVKYAPTDIGFAYFSWPRALFSSYDVFHVHWPEFLVRSESRAKRRLNEVLFRALLRRLEHRNIGVVRTVHNLEPHERGSEKETSLLARLDRLVTTYVVLNDCTPMPPEAHTTVVRHGDYVEQFAPIPRAAIEPGRVLSFGRIEPYKGVVELLDTFGAADTDGIFLRIVGRASDELKNAIEQRVEANPDKYSARLEHVTDADMVAEMSASELVVLPYKEMHNSGVLLVALSLDRPVLVPRGCVNESIADEVGKGWVIQYDGVMEVETVRAALATARARRTTSPDLRARTWQRVASDYATCFRDTARRHEGTAAGR